MNICFFICSPRAGWCHTWKANKTDRKQTKQHQRKDTAWMKKQYNNKRKEEHISTTCDVLLQSIPEVCSSYFSGSHWFPSIWNIKKINLQRLERFFFLVFNSCFHLLMRQLSGNRDGLLKLVLFEDGHILWQWQCSAFLCVQYVHECTTGRLTGCVLSFLQPVVVYWHFLLSAGCQLPLFHRIDLWSLFAN